MHSNISQSVEKIFTAGQRYFYLPEGLDLKAILPEGLIPAAHYLIDLIYWRRIHLWLGYGFVPLKFDYLTQVMGTRNAATIIERLIDARILERRDTYCKGKLCKGYRLREPYHSSTHRRTPVANLPMARKLAAVARKRLHEITLDVHVHLLKHLRSLEVTSTNHPQLAWIDEKRTAVLNPCDDFGTRFHSCLTNLSSDLRRFLKVNGQGLVALDIANSQPFFLCPLLKNFYANNHDLKPLNSFEDKGMYLPLEALLIQDKKLNLPDDVILYFRLCQSGTLYEFLCSETDLNREEVKDQLMTCFFARNYCSNKVKRSLVKNFPSVMSFVHELKVTNHKHCSQMLQRMEASVMLNRVVRLLMERVPDVFVATVHDSIVTTVDNTHIVDNIVKEVFNSFNLLPTIRTHFWSEEGEGHHYHYNDFHQCILLGI
jgi:hypothetical protein